jgi:hypothetical protein
MIEMPEKKFYLLLILVAFLSIILAQVLKCNMSYSNDMDKKEPKEEVQESKEEVGPNWDLVRDADFDIDMEKMHVVFIKRSFSPSTKDEATLIQYEDGDYDYFVCSMEVHDRLIRKFREILRKRESEGN